jgi:uncharacterized membrane protein YcaP (DUF421 family)
MFFHTWADVGRVVLTATIVFLSVVAMLRVVGQQALAKMSGFDVVFTVTLGSVVANVVVTRSIAVVDALAALATLLLLQELIRRFQSRYLPMHHLVRQPPRVLLWDGVLLEDRLRASSVSADEIRAAVRRAGLPSLSEVQVVVLENDGEWSVVPKTSRPSDESAFYGLPIPGRAGSAPNGDATHAIPAPVGRLP